MPEECDNLAAITLHADALKRMANFFERMEHEARKGDLSDVRAFALRGTELACRIAGVLAAFDGKSHVDSATASNGTRLAEHSLRNWLDALGGKSDPVPGWAFTLYRWLAELRGLVAVRDIPRIGPASVRPANRRDRAILSLADHASLPLQPDEQDGAADTAAADALDTLALADGARAAALRMHLDLGTPADDDGAATQAVLLPEWDHRRHCLVEARCSVREQPQAQRPGLAFPPQLEATRRRLRAQFAQAMPPNATRRAQPDGDELDLDRVVRQHARGDSADRLYLDRRARRRDLSCLLLADLSLSTDAAADGKRRVIEVIREGLLLFAETLAASQERFALYGFSSRGRLDVRWHPLKRFAQPYDAAARARGRHRARLLHTPGRRAAHGHARIAQQRLARATAAAQRRQAQRQ